MSELLKESDVTVGGPLLVPPVEIVGAVRKVPDTSCSVSA